MISESAENNNNADNNNPYANVLDNYLRYISNLEQNPKNDPELVQKVKQLWRREMIKHPTIFMKCFSDNPILYQEAMEEISRLEYEMKYPWI
jgi:hypothetical protein